MSLRCCSSRHSSPVEDDIILLDGLLNVGCQRTIAERRGWLRLN